MSLLLSYFEGKNKEYVILDCHTPHIVLGGPDFNKIIELEKLMMKNLSSSNGSNIDLILVDGIGAISDDFLNCVRFNSLEKITTQEAYQRLKEGIVSFKDRIDKLSKSECRNYDEYVAKGNSGMHQVVYFFSDLYSCENKERLLKALQKCSTVFFTGVNIISGISNCDIFINKYLCEHNTRVGNPYADELKNRIFFDERNLVERSGDRMIIKLNNQLHILNKMNPIGLE